jgi:hypothetical protein
LVHLDQRRASTRWIEQRFDLIHLIFNNYLHNLKIQKRFGRLLCEQVHAKRLVENAWADVEGMRR